jgi:3',5'-cyclic AMP phosphodiesterase CpdA
MGFVVFQHHTHPKVPWYGNEDDWTFYAGQVQSVVHVELPRPIELILHNIMEHTAHHVDPRIPALQPRGRAEDTREAYEADLVVFPVHRSAGTSRRCARAGSSTTKISAGSTGTARRPRAAAPREDSHGKVVRTVYAEAIPSSPALF